MEELSTSTSLLGAWLGLATLNLAYILVISERAELNRRLKFTTLTWLEYVVAVVCRWKLLTLGMTHNRLFWALGLPLSVFETTAVQAMADLFEGRPLKAPTMKQVYLQAKVVCVESVGYHLGLHVWPWLLTEVLTVPTVGSLLHAVWRAALFDVGLDIGFYAFHRCCHVNRTLYRLVHAPHHTDTSKEYGHLVAYETYEISIVETLFIASSYLVGFELLGLIYKFNWFDIAIYVSWAHLLELIGHTEMTFTPIGHWLRLIPDVLGLSLQVPHHTMHHQKPLSNFSKRLILFDLMFQTYEPPKGVVNGFKRSRARAPRANTEPLDSSSTGSTRPLTGTRKQLMADTLSNGVVGHTDTDELDDTPDPIGHDHLAALPPRTGKTGNASPLTQRTPIARSAAA